MSEQAAPSAPIDTTAIASHALESLEQAQSAPPSAPAPAPAPAGEAPSASPSSPPADGAVTPGAPAIELSEAETLLREEGYKHARKPDGREPWIPRSRVLKMIESGLRKRAETLEKERGVWEQERAQAQQAWQQVQHWRQLMNGDPQALLARMAQVDPRYQVYLQQRAAAAAAEPEDPEPEPDLDLGGGRMTYSLEGIRKVRAWERRQMERAVNERLAPLAERARQEQAAEHRARVEHTLRERTTASLSKARSWPRFGEHEAAITEVLRKDTADSEARGLPPQKTLHDAYMEVVGGTLTADHQKVREQVMRELNGAPRSTSVTTNGSEPTRKPGPLTAEEIARRAYARLEGRTP